VHDELLAEVQVRLVHERQQGAQRQHRHDRAPRLPRVPQFDNKGAILGKQIRERGA
jgi:hypothetical protein